LQTTPTGICAAGREGAVHAEEGCRGQRGYTIVGEVYIHGIIHGIIHGEALALAIGGFQWEDIQIR
jgi:hypothetical protein